MNKIDRLLKYARIIKNGAGMRVIGFVDYDIEKQVYTASGTIWNGVDGSGGRPFYSEHHSAKEAIAACENVASQYEGLDSFNFIVDYGLDDESGGSHDEAENAENVNP